MNLAGIWAVFRFECSRTITPARIFAWLVLALFPVVITAMVVATNRSTINYPHLWTVLMYVMAPCVVSVLGLLLWATPAIHAELEGKTWAYLAVRPEGKRNMLIGKYLAALLWTSLAAATGLILSLAIVHRQDSFRVGVVMLQLVILACVTYGAVFMLLGVVFLKRAMVLAMGYVLLLEVVVSLLPAMINQLTVQYHLRTFMVQSLKTDNIDVVTKNMPFGTGAAWLHALILVAASIVILALAVRILKQRQLVVNEES